MKTKTTRDGKITYITEPLGTEELHNLCYENEQGMFQVVVGVSIGDIAFGCGYEDFLDLLTERVCGDKGIISDICHTLVGADVEEGLALIEVCGDFMEFDEL